MIQLSHFIIKGEPGTRGQASNEIQEHYSDKISVSTLRVMYKLSLHLKLKNIQTRSKWY